MCFKDKAWIASINHTQTDLKSTVIKVATCGTVILPNMLLVISKISLLQLG